MTTRFAPLMVEVVIENLSTHEAHKAFDMDWNHSKSREGLNKLFVWAFFNGMAVHMKAKA